jgi:hypothetical protein
VALLDQAVPARIDPGDPVATPERSGRPWLQWAVAVAVTAVALAPIITVILQRWGRVYVPTGDQATLDLRIRDVWTFSSDTPLTGPYSRFGWNHPGPTMYYLLALFSAMARQRAWASLVGSVVLQGVAVAWIARLSWKSGGLRWMVPWLAVVTLSYWATGPWIYLQLWNPYLPYPFFTLLLLQAWLVGSGQGRRLVGMAFVGSFLIQTHVSYALPVMAISLWAVVRLVAAEHRAGRHLGGWARWRAPLIVLAVVWFVPLGVDTALHYPGNVTRIVQFTLGLGPSRHLPFLGIHGALGYLATEFRWHPPWLGGPDRVNQYTSLTSPSSPAYLLLPAVLIGTSWCLARWRRRADLVALVELLAVAGVSGVLALTVLTGPAYPYLFLWRIPLAAAVVILSLVVVVETVAGTGLRATMALCSVLATALAVASVSLTQTVAAADGPVTPMEPVAASIIRQLHHDGQPRTTVLLRVYGTPLGGLHAALVDQLAREGAPVYVDPDLGYQFGAGRTATPSEVGAVWYVIEESELYSLVVRIPGVQVLAVSHPLPAPQQAELVALQQKMADELTAEGRAGQIGDLGSEDVVPALAGVPGLDPADLDLLAALNRRVVRHTCLCSVVAVPARRIPPLLENQ